VYHVILGEERIEHDKSGWVFYISDTKKQEHISKGIFSWK